MAMLRRASIRTQLLGLTLAVALPLTALQTWIVYREAREDARQAHQQVFHLAEVTASETAKFLAQTRNITRGLAARAAVSALDPARCDPILQDFLKLSPRFANAFTLDAEGRLVCSAVRLAAGRPDRVDPVYFLRRLRETGEFTIGSPAQGFITGRWVVTAAHPLRDAEGRISGAVGLAIDLLTLPVLPTLSGLPDKSSAGIVAADGTVIARSLEPGRFIGTKTGAASTPRRAKTGTAEVTGIDGIARVQGFAPVAGSDWVAVASVPADAVYAPVYARAAQSAGLLNGVRVFANLIDLRSSTLAAHGKRVAEQARSLAVRMGMGPADTQHVALAGLLHDLGRLALADSALVAPVSALGGAQREEHTRHPARGADLLGILASTQAAGEIVRAHHERFDGSGYPHGLRGADIPLGARILAVADDYDEAVCGMLMQSPLTSAKALRYLEAGRGKRYEPAIVDAFVAAHGGARPEEARRELDLRPAQLEPGMVVARDIVAPGGKLLLVSGYTLDHELIEGLRNFETTAGCSVRVWVRVAGVTGWS